MDRPTAAGRPLYDRDHGGGNLLRNRTARKRLVERRPAGCSGRDVYRRLRGTCTRIRERRCAPFCNDCGTPSGDWKTHQPRGRTDRSHCPGAWSQACNREWPRLCRLQHYCHRSLARALERKPGTQAGKPGTDRTLPIHQPTITWIPPPVWAELVCGEIFQGAKASVEFGGREAPQAVERTQKIPGWPVALARVAFETAGNQVAVGIASEAHAWHNVVEAVHVSGSAAETVKARAAFTIVNGFAGRPGFQESGGLEGGGRRLPAGPRGAISARAERSDLLGQAHLRKMAGLAAFEHAQNPQLVEPAHRIARRSNGETQSARQGHDRKLQAELADDEGMAQQIRVDGSLIVGQSVMLCESYIKNHPV